ncbi:MAG: ketoacyl-ACP synthase III [Candidatus Solibacter sp.]
MAFLKAFGRYVPELVVDNAELAARLECDARWIFEVSGIAQRRFAAADELVVDMAVAAAHDCLRRAALEANEIGMLVVSSGSAEPRFPGPAASVAQRLGCGPIPAWDVPLASAGGLFGMSLANAMAPRYGTVLVVAAEKMSALAMREPLDRNVAILFGDGAGACLVSPHQGFAEISAEVLHSDGSFAGDLRAAWDTGLAMNGRTVILQAGRKLPAGIFEVLASDGVSVEDVEVFLLHQANQNLTDRVAKVVGVPVERFYSNIERYGNTSSASMLIAAAEYFAEAPASRKPVVFAAFGAGFHWGAMLVRQA